MREAWIFLLRTVAMAQQLGGRDRLLMARCAGSVEGVEGVDRRRGTLPLHDCIIMKGRRWRCVAE